MTTVQTNLLTGRYKEVWKENVGVPLLKRSEASEDWAEACPNPADPINATNTTAKHWALGPACFIEVENRCHLQMLHGTEHVSSILPKISNAPSSLRSALIQLSPDRRHTHRWPSQVPIFRSRTTL